ncbi:UDP-3-O-(3-hydroxymyristoyl)glucosamine N-acyltransferase [Oceanospirillum maris]|uniref:UDP-3-O-(3-hydroxymyristoyl)glucosamine N-acyltransferase n=1 Tax=Oceanospirillum maris TaxID=64977 RepID=UPI0004169FED|nr:UDP-3-O-(3-hydroxymyristoyl)glucosamine N-acyltransferase [Oceanospirillum maris]
MTSETPFSSSCNKPQYSLLKLAEILQGELRGAAELVITGIGTLQNADGKQASFLANSAYQKHLKTTKAGVVLLKAQQAEQYTGNAIVLDNPYEGYARLTQLFTSVPSCQPGIHPQAYVHPSATVAKSAQVDAFAVVEAGAEIGEHTVISSHCYIGRDSIIGDGCRLYPNVTLYHGVVLGRQVTLHSSCVIGGDGFGFAPEKGRWIKIAQLGGVIIGDRTEIGANTNIDRGALDNTEIGCDVIIDSQVQIAHNVKIGQGTAIAGCVGIAGSATIGCYCLIGGASNIAGHLSICDGVTLTMTTNVTGDIKEPGHYSSGTGMTDTRTWRKNAVRFNQLDCLVKRVNKIEKSLSPAATKSKNLK